MIKSAVDEKKIEKVMLPNRTVLYGLSEFGQIGFGSSSKVKTQPEVLSFQDVFFYNCFQKLEQIGDLNAENSWKAMLQTRSLLMRLPKSYREKLLPRYLRAEKSLRDKWNREVVGFRPPLTGATEVDFLIGEISDSLHEQFEKTFHDKPQDIEPNGKKVEVR